VKENTTTHLVLQPSLVQGRGQGGPSHRPSCYEVSLAVMTSLLCCLACSFWFVDFGMADFGFEDDEPFDEGEGGLDGGGLEDGEDGVDVPEYNGERDEEVAELICQAQDALFASDYDTAVKAAGEVLEINEKQEEVYEILAVSLIRLRRFQEAAEACAIWIDFFPPTIKALSLLLESSYLAALPDFTKRATHELSSFTPPADGPQEQRPAWLVLFTSNVMVQDLDPAHAIPAHLSEAQIGASEDEDVRRKILLAWPGSIDLADGNDLEALFAQLVERKTDSPDGRRRNLALAFALVRTLCAQLGGPTPSILTPRVGVFFFFCFVFSGVGF